MRVNTIAILFITLILAMPQQAFSLRPTSTAISKPDKDWLKPQKHKVNLKVLMPPLEPPMLGPRPVSPARSIAVQSAIKRSV